MAQTRGIEFENVLSDALLGLALAIKRVAPGRSLSPYAKAYMKGHMLKGMRTRVRHPIGTLVDPEAFVNIAADWSTDPSIIVWTEQLWQMVKSLPPRQYICMVLYYKDGLSQRIIAETLKTNQQTVSRELDCAHKIIGKWIGERE